MRDASQRPTLIVRHGHVHEVYPIAGHRLPGLRLRLRSAERPGMTCGRCARRPRHIYRGMAKAEVCSAEAVRASRESIMAELRNRLSEATSPYLLQHADNPVHWQPWDEEALAAAKAQDRPILLSIGYAACHWCYVMAHESFENPAIAGLMN